MLTWHLRGVRLGLLALAMALTLIAAGCDGDGEDATTPPAETVTPAADGSDETPTTSGGSALDNVTAYVTGTGLDGETFEVAQPINCNAFLDPEADPVTFQAAQGKVCIDFRRSEFSETEGVMGVLVVGTEDRWRLTLKLQNLSWVVTGAEYADE
jgi:hypothetical protein